MTKIHGNCQAGPSAGQDLGVSRHKKAKDADADAFSSAVNDKNTGQPEAAGGDEKTTEDLLKEARMNLIMSTARTMQNNAKDIERENIDRGF